MGRSTLNTTGEGRAVTRKGHGTGALGPSDSSDSGSDVVGGPGLDCDDPLPLQHGTTSDPDVDPAPTTAGADLGDADLDSDSDRHGTGERAAAGRDSSEATDETLTEHDPQPLQPLDAMDDSATARDADDIESDDDPEGEVEAIERIERRGDVERAVRRQRR